MVEQPIRKSRFIPRYSPPHIYNDAIKSGTVGLSLFANMHLSLH